VCFSEPHHYQIKKLNRYNSTSSLADLDNTVTDTKQVLLKGVRAKTQPWFALSTNQLLPLCYACDSVHHRAHHCPIKQNKCHIQDAKKHLDAAMDFAKQQWVMDLAAVIMDVKQDPTSSWKAKRVLEQGLQHHHTANRSVCMTKQDGNKAKADK
jgi:hypothetical protein